MSTVLKFTDPNGGPIYFDVNDNLTVSIADPTAAVKMTKITCLDSGVAFLVSEPPEQVCSLLEGLQRT